MIYLAVICFVLLLYSYAGFPLLILLLARVRPRPWKTDETTRPTVSILLPVFNEELILRRCLSALVDQRYPSERIEILCGSDGSTDASNSILEEFAAKHSWIHPILFPRQRGKMFVLNDLVRMAQHEILFFSDADVTLSSDAIASHLSNYADTSVGGVTGPLVFATNRLDGTAASEFGFLSMENTLRRAEALVYSTTGFYGCNWSMRRSLWKELPSQKTCDDFFAYLAVVDRGKRLVFDERAVATEIYGRSAEDEFSRKTRYAARSLDAVSHFPRLLYSWPAAAFIWPRKLMRWLGFIPATLLVVAGFVGLARGEMWSYGLLALETLVLLLAFVGWLARGRSRSIPVASIMYWFLQMNLAFVRGAYEFVFSKQDLIWSQTTRISDSTVAAIRPEVHRP